MSDGVVFEVDASALSADERAELQAAIDKAVKDGTIESVAEAQGAAVGDPDEPGPEEVVTLLIITGAVIGVGLILRALPFGQLIDLRTDPPKTRLKWGLHSKLILVIGVDGKVEIKANEGKDVLDTAMGVLVDLFKASIKTVEDIAKAVKDALGDKVTVSTTPSS